MRPEGSTTLALDPHWFRRAVHAFGSTFVVWYLIPAEAHPVWWAVKWLLPAVLLALAAGLEVTRLTGILPQGTLFGLRSYEQGRVGGYLYFGVAGVLLLYFFPQAIAVPCLVGMALLDPLVGELRRRGHGRWGHALAVGLAAGLFLVSGWGWPFAFLAAGVMTLGETVKVRALDDDLLMALAPALLLVALTATGWGPVPEPFLRPLSWGGG